MGMFFAGASGNRRVIMEPVVSQPECERCGVPALVHIRTESAGVAAVRHLCLKCADLEHEASQAIPLAPNVAAILIVVGALVALISAFADPLGFGGAAGFGWQQWSGILIAGILVLAGAIVQAPTLPILGLLVGMVTLLADWLGLGSAAGFGWQQGLGVAVGVALILLGFGLTRRSSGQG